MAQSLPTVVEVVLEGQVFCKPCTSLAISGFLHRALPPYLLVADTVKGHVDLKHIQNSASKVLIVIGNDG
jgi:hypothetical protein